MDFEEPIITEDRYHLAETEKQLSNCKTRPYSVAFKLQKNPRSTEQGARFGRREAQEQREVQQHAVRSSEVGVGSRLADAVDLNVEFLIV